MAKVQTSFFDKIKGCRRILVMDLGFLGDSIHIFPALWEIKKACPDAILEVMVADHIKGFLKVLPWVDVILGYPRFPKGPKWYEDLGRVWKLRKERYDVVINLNGSDRSSILTWATAAPYRLGRVPPREKAFWKYTVTDKVQMPRGTMPVYQQSIECLKQAGFPIEGTGEFNVELPQEALEAVKDLVHEEDHFIHVSPFTTLDFKELPLDIMVKFFNQLNGKYPGLKLIFSCAPNDRERGKLIALLAGLNFEPYRVFDGKLSLMELAAIIGRSILHIGGDSGAIHVALMMGARTLSWFREYDNKAEWMPTGEGHVHVIGQASDQGLQGIQPNDLLSAFESMIPDSCKG